MTAMTQDPTAPAAEGISSKPAAQKRRRRRGLSPARQRLAERYMAMARTLSKPYKAAWPTAWEDFESAALYALVEAAEAFDPQRNIKFGTYARIRILGALRDVKREMGEASRARNEGELAPSPMTRLEAVSDYGDGFVLGIEPEPPVGTELENLEVVERWLHRLPAHYAATCRQLYLLGRSQAEAARVLGLSQSRLSNLHRAALDLIGFQFFPGRRPRGGDGASA